MDAHPWLAGALLLAVAALGCIATLSALETAVLNARRSRLPQSAPERRLRAAEALIEAPDAFESSAHLVKSLLEALLYSAAALSGLEIAISGAEPPPASTADLLARAWPGLVVGILLAYFALTLFGEALPKAWATRRPEALLLRAAGAIRLFTLLCTPLLWLASRTGRALAVALGSEPVVTTRAAHSEEEIKLLVEGSAEEGVLEEEEKEMIHSIFEFTETVARQVMVPRIDIRSVPVEASLDEVVQQVLASGHSRLPVYEETLDNIVGIIHVKDLLPFLVTDRRDVSIRELLREPLFVPEGKKIDELLQEFRLHKSQMAIVVDEFGGTSGLVTLEDVLEEIVGEIEDEYDQEIHPGAVVATSGEGTIVDARMTIADVNEALGLDLPREDYDTLGGLVFSLFGRPPGVGERVTHGNVEFVAEAMDGLRLQKVRIIVHPPPEEPEES